MTNRGFGMEMPDVAGMTHRVAGMTNGVAGMTRKGLMMKKIGFTICAMILLLACSKKDDLAGTAGGNITTSYRIDFSKVDAFDSATVQVLVDGDTIIDSVYTEENLEEGKLRFQFDAKEFQALKIECLVYRNGELVARSKEVLTSGDVPQQPALNLAPIAEAGSDSLVSQRQEKMFVGTAIDRENGVVAYQWDYDGDGVWDDSLPKSIGFAHAYADTGHFAAVFQVTDNVGLQGRDTLIVVVRNLGPTVDSVWFAGALQEDSSVIVDYRYQDIEDDAEGTSKVQWLRNGKVVADAKELEYEISYADSGAKLACVITPMAKAGTPQGEADTFELGTVVGFRAPVASNVVVSGTPRVDSTLKASYTFSDADGNPEGVSLYQWYRNEEAIAGATKKTYKLVTADTDARITFEVIPVSAEGKNPKGKSVKSGETENVAYPTAPYVTDVSVGGALYRDSTLTAVYTYKDDNGDKELGTTYQWYRNGSAISGAKGKAYKITLADKDAQIRVQVKPGAAEGEYKNDGVAVMSPPAGPVLGYTAPVASSVAISGKFAQGGTLTVGYTYSDKEKDLEGASMITWYRTSLNGTSKFQSGVSKTYNITKADSGQRISVTVTPVASTGYILEGNPVGTTVEYDKVTGFHYPEAQNFHVSGLSKANEEIRIDYKYVDADLDSAGIPQIQWCREDYTAASSSGDCDDPGSNSTYTLKPQDIGKLIVVRLRPVAKTGENLVGEMVVDTIVV